MIFSAQTLIVVHSVTESSWKTALFPLLKSYRVCAAPKVREEVLSAPCTLPPDRVSQSVSLRLSAEGLTEAFSGVSRQG